MLHAKARIRLAVALALVCALAVPAVASARLTMALAADDEIPGVALPASPVLGTLDGDGTTYGAMDWDDVYSWPLTMNQQVTVSVETTGPLLDADLYLYSPGTTTINAFERIVAGSELATSQALVDTFTYVASTTGTYYVDVFNAEGTGSYTLTYSDPVQLNTPPVTISAPSVVNYGAYATISGVVTTDGVTPHSGAAVWVYAKPYGKSWTKVATVLTNASGAWSKALKPTVQTQYRAVVQPKSGTNQGYSYSSIVTVTPKAYLTSPTVPSTVYDARVYTVYGYLKPQFTSGSKTVLLTFEHKEGTSYVPRMTVYTNTSSYSSYSKYSAPIAFPYGGYWRVKASIAGSYKAAATTTGYVTRYVR